MRLRDRYDSPAGGENRPMACLRECLVPAPLPAGRRAAPAFSVSQGATGAGPGRAFRNEEA
jgi:hypothetical protein